MALADGHDRHAVPADIAADQDGVARLNALGRDFLRVLKDADPGGVDEEAVAFAFIDDLGIAGDDLHAGLLRGLLHRGDDLPKGFHGQAFLNDVASAEVERARARHRKVVNRAVHSQGAEVATGKEERLHDVGIGSESEALAADFEHARIVLRFQERIAEGGQEQLADELMHQLAAAAVSEQHLGVVLDGEGTGGGEVGRNGHESS
jgi:hypothetical protein